MPKQPSVQQARAKRTRDDLLEAARRVFAAQGYAGATIDDITAAAAVSKGAYYFHFEAKEDILVALVQRWASEVSERVGALTRGISFEQGGLRLTIEGLLSAGDSAWQPRLLLEFLIQADGNDDVKEALMGAREVWRTCMAKLLSRARRAGYADSSLSPDAMALTLLAIRDGLIMQACLPGTNRAADVRTAAKAALSLLQPFRDLRRVS